VNLFYQPLLTEGALYLDAEESRHCVKVLRRSQGDVILVTDGKGHFYDVLITKADPQKCSFEIQRSIPEPSRNHFVHVAISPTKNADRIEWFVEKAVEFGIDKITLMECHYTERTYLKTERLQKVAISAMKQSLKASVPIIEGLMPFDKVVSTAQEQQRFIAFVDQSNPHHLKALASPSTSAIVLIGPEGDFTKEELSRALQSGFQKVSLGNSRLRTETAGLAACHILNLVNS
jgi:16S rRNA (uracil1498-N3)-methyltransferase